MKKITVLLSLLLLVTSASFAQHYTPYNTQPSTNGYIFLGTLPVSDIYNLHKIKVSITGGAWESTSSGETIFYIANRNQLTINRVTIGGSSDARYVLKGYYGGGGTMSFYLLTNSYTSIAVSSYLNGTAVTTSLSATLPAGLTEISPLTINNVQTTDMAGNVGLGTENTRGYKFAVNGGIRASSVKVEASPWPDFVFKPTYKLRTLSEVEDYIEKYQHLPDVPSAAKVEKEGLDVGEMNALLMKKVEELTLYLIEQKQTQTKQSKQIIELKNEVRNLRKQIKNR